MTPTDRRSAVRARDRLVCAVFAFMTVLVIGGGAGMMVVNGFKAQVQETARRDAKIIGETVARSLAGQFEKAARFGIPLKLLPGVETYLAETMARTPGLTRIVVRGPDGREVRSAIGPVTGLDTVIAPILVDGIPLGQVDVTTTPATLSSVLGSLNWRTGYTVLVCAVLSGVAAAFTAGTSLTRGRKRLARALSASAAGNPESALSGASQGQGVIAAAFSALVTGERQQANRRAAFLGYAEELLAVDFDGRLRAEIERIRREAAAKPQQGQRDA